MFNWKSIKCKGQGRFWRGDGICMGPQRNYTGLWTGRGAVPGVGQRIRRNKRKTETVSHINLKKRSSLERYLESLPKNLTFF